MKITKNVLLTVAVCGAQIGLTLPMRAQQQDSMPGMPGMDHSAPAKPQAPGNNQQKPMPDMPNMPGMDHGTHGKKKQQLPGDMQMPMPDDPAAQKETQSEKNSERQQQGQEQGGKPGAASDSKSTTHDTLRLQEPENPDFHIGSNKPAPLLLGEISKRAPMPLQAFLDAAEKGNPTLPQSNAVVQQSLQQARQVGLYPNPSVGYQGEQIRGGAYGGGQGGFVQQSIVLGGKLRARSNVYKQQAGSNILGVEEQHFRIRNDVMQAFYTTLTSQAIVVERQNLLNVAQDALTTAHQLANVGQADAPDVLQAEVETEQAKIDFVAAQRDFLQNFSALAGELDQPPVFDSEAKVADIVVNSPTLKRARQEVVVAESRLNDAKREAIPDLLLRAGEQDNRETLVEVPRRRVGPQTFASIGVNIPLWNHNQGNVGAAKAEVERARQDVTRTQLLLKQQAEPLAQSYETARFQAERYREELIPRARRAYELYLTKYQQTAEAYPQVIVSQRTLFQVQIGYLQSLETVWATGAALQNYTLRGGLESSIQSGQDSTTLNLPNGGLSE